METGVRPGPRNAAAAIDERTAPRLAGAIAVAWEGEAKPGGEPEPATYAETRDSRTARGVAAVVGVLAVAAALAIATRATESGERAAHPGRTRGWFRGAPALAAPMSGPADGRTPGRGEQDMRSLVTAGAALAIGAAAQAQVGEPVQWRVEDGGNGHWYAIEHTSIGWSDARASARQLGADLMCAEAVIEWDWLWTWLPPTSSDYHLGGFQSPAATCVTCGWTWVTGESITGIELVMDDNACSDYGTENQEQDRLALWFAGKALGDINDTTPRSPCHAPRPSIIEWSADCDSNGIVDFGEIRAGQLPDQNANNVPDTCECTAHPELDACCPGDLYRNGVVNGADLGILLAEWGEITPTTTADLNRDGAVDGSDLGILLSNWGACPG